MKAEDDFQRTMYSSSMNTCSIAAEIPAHNFCSYHSLSSDHVQTNVLRLAMNISMRCEILVSTYSRLSSPFVHDHNTRQSQSMMKVMERTEAELKFSLQGSTLFYLKS